MADDITPRALADRWTPPEDALPLRQGALAQAFKGALVDPVVSGVTAAKDAYDGKFDPSSDEGIGRALGTAGLAMTGGVGGAPAGALGSGPIRAYHGSPHDFDRFDISKIGTGEGAQAYGHGLYFAENEGVAKSYRDTLSKNLNLTVDGAPIDSLSADQRLFAHMANTGVDLDGELARFQKRLAQIPDGPDPYGYNRRSRESYQGSIDAIQSVLGRKIESAPGRMYEVNLHADPERLLDWDKPLQKQSPHVQDALQSALSEMYQGASRRYIDDRIGDGYIRRIHQDLVGRHGPAGLSEYLKKAEIPGIRYFDEGSRADGGTRNYVMFDDKPVEIVRKYATGGRVDELDVQALPQRMHEPDGDILDYIINQNTIRNQGQIPPVDWAGDLSGVDRRRLVPPRPVKKADGGRVRSDQDVDSFFEQNDTGGAKGIDRMRRHLGPRDSYHFNTPVMQHDGQSNMPEYGSLTDPAWLDNVPTDHFYADGGIVDDRSLGTSPEPNYSPEQIQAALAYLALIQSQQDDAEG